MVECVVTDNIKRRKLRFARHCYRYKDEVASITILWQPAHGMAKRGRPAATCRDSLKDDVGLQVEDIKQR